MPRRHSFISQGVYWIPRGSFEYKINIGACVFVVVITLSILITLVMVSFQAIRAAMANPTRSLRTE